MESSPCGGRQPWTQITPGFGCVFAEEWGHIVQVCAWGGGRTCIRARAAGNVSVLHIQVSPWSCVDMCCCLDVLACVSFSGSLCVHVLPEYVCVCVCACVMHMHACTLHGHVCLLLCACMYICVDEYVHSVHASVFPYFWMCVTPCVPPDPPPPRTRVCTPSKCSPPLV